jgi:hypothetical protein
LAFGDPWFGEPPTATPRWPAPPIGAATAGPVSTAIDATRTNGARNALKPNMTNLHL